MTPTGQPRLRRFCDLTVIVLFIAAVSMPLAGMVVPGPWRVDDTTTERRTLAPAPRAPASWAALAAFPDAFEAFANDHFTGRTWLVRAHQRWTFFVLRDSPSPKVERGRGAWLLFDGDATEDDHSPLADALGIAPLSASRLERLRWMFQDQHEFLRDHEIPYHLVLLPSKPFVYPEVLPPYARNRPHPGWRRQLSNHLARHTRVPVLDVTDAVLAEKEQQRVWVMTDTHWNQPGAAAAYREIIRHLGAFLTIPPPWSSDDFTLVAAHQPGGDLARLIGLADELSHEHLYLQPDRKRLSTEAPTAEGEFVEVIAGTGDPAHPTAIIYRDSFANVILPFLGEHFRSVRYVWGQKGSLMVGVEEDRPDVVMQIMADRVLPRSLIYAPRMQEHCARKRFAAANPGRAWSAREGIEGLRAVEPTAWSTRNRRLLLSTPQGPIRLALPRIDNLSTTVPILSLAFYTPSRCECILVGGQGPDAVRYLRRVVDVGNHVLHLPLYDPSTRQPLFIELASEQNTISFDHLEIRHVPRY